MIDIVKLMQSIIIVIAGGWVVAILILILSTGFYGIIGVLVFVLLISIVYFNLDFILERMNR